MSVEKWGNRFDEHTQKPIESSVGISEWQENQKQLVVPQEVQQKLEKAGWNNALGNQQEEYDKFSQYVSSLSVEKRQEVFQMILSATSIKLRMYTKKNGYILAETLPDFEKKFQKENLIEEYNHNFLISKKIEKTKEWVENAEKQVKEFVEIFKSRSVQFSHIPDFQNLVERANSVEQLTNEEIEQLDNDIRNFFARGKNLEKVADVFRKNSDKKAYQEFTSYATKLDSTFATRLQQFEKHYGKTLEEAWVSDFRQAQIVWGLWTEKYHKYGNIGEVQQWDNVIRMDMGETPPRRFLGVKEDDYSLETDLPVGDFYKAVSNEGSEYESIAKKNWEKASYLDALSSKEVQEFLQSEDFWKESLTNVIRIISTMIGLPTELSLGDVCGQSFSDKTQLKNFVLSGNGILSQKQKLEKEVEKKKKMYQKALKQHVAEYSKKLQEKDKKTKETLNFLKSIGFTKIPQWLTDRIIEAINIHPKQYGFQEEINFSQGQLGMDKNVGESWVLDLADKQAFAKFINKMIGITDEDGNPPINVSALASGNAPVGDTIKFQALLAKSGLMKIGGVEIALDNLSKTEQ